MIISPKVNLQNYVNIVLYIPHVATFTRPMMCIASSSIY